MIEVGVLFDRAHQPIYWHEPPGRSSIAIPDTRSLWEVFWANRECALGFAHSHPGRGIAGPTHEDVTTFAAIERALGCKFQWWVITENDCRAFRVRYDILGSSGGVPFREITHELRIPDSGLAWLPELRRRSYGKCE